MRIEQLEYLAAVTRHGSLRRASEHLHISQPALSESVSKLERELGVPLLDRRRSGAVISREGRDLLQHMTAVLDAVDRLRSAAGDHDTTPRQVRVGTVNAATSSLVAPALAAVRASRPSTTIELLTMQQADIDRGLEEGSLDLGLVNELPGDDRPVELVSTDLAHGRPVVVLPTGHRLTQGTSVDVEQLRAEPFIAMRAGYVMHRFAHRVFDGRLPAVVHSTDGAELGKVLVAEGLGLTLLPDFSVVGDPLERAGLIEVRPLVVAGPETVVTLVLRRRRSDRLSAPVRELQAALVAQAGSYSEASKAS